MSENDCFELGEVSIERVGDGSSVAFDNKVTCKDLQVAEEPQS
jgi:hypothetical protein